jgi:8-oxo-dGTP pyrophosphatase MutT (NUDIX family)
MIITDTYTSKKTGLVWDTTYEELDSFDSIRDLPIGAAGALCFCGDKLVLVYAHRKDSWEMPGGGLEEGETFEQGVAREIQEESNMKVLELVPLGLETYTYPATQEIFYVLRYAARVEPYGPFESDPAGGEITAMQLVDPSDYKKYFDWGQRSDMLMEKARRVLCI